MTNHISEEDERWYAYYDKLEQARNYYGEQLFAEFLQDVFGDRSDRPIDRKGVFVKQINTKQQGSGTNPEERIVGRSRLD